MSLHFKLSSLFIGRLRLSQIIDPLPMDLDFVYGRLFTILKTLTFQYPIAYGKIDYVEEDKLKRLKQVLRWMEDMVSNF